MPPPSVSHLQTLSPSHTLTVGEQSLQFLPLRALYPPRMPFDLPAARLSDQAVRRVARPAGERSYATVLDGNVPDIPVDQLRPHGLSIQSVPLAGLRTPQVQNNLQAVVSTSALQWAYQSADRAARTPPFFITPPATFSIANPPSGTSSKEFPEQYCTFSPTLAQATRSSSCYQPLNSTGSVPLASRLTSLHAVDLLC